jgi:LmbE family N-acetylglucosaminyl deacetylase
MSAVLAPVRVPSSTVHGRTVVVVHAHPDDESIFTAATMRRLADRGARVVLVTATAGELGPVLRPLRPGETLAGRRRAELEHAAAALGVARLVLLGHRDSGMPGWDDNAHPDALAAASVSRVAARLATLCEEENAEALVHYDPDGIYGHPDHVAVHRFGAQAARLTGITAYEATVAGDRAGTGHLVDRAAGRRVGRADATTVLVATAAERRAKRAAMAAHASQIPPDALHRDGFAGTYGTEWFRRVGPAGLIDSIL